MTRQRALELAKEWQAYGTPFNAVADVYAGVYSAEDCQLLACELIALAGANARMTRVYEAAMALDRMDYSKAHYRGCGQTSMKVCVACQLDEAREAAVAGLEQTS